MQLVEQGRISEERIDASVRRLLREKFVLGLFDNPYVDPGDAAATVGKAEFVTAGADAQRQAYTLLTNQAQILPLGRRCRLYLEGVSEEVAAHYGDVVDSPADAEIALLRLKAPYEPRPGGFEARFHAGSLEFPADERDHHAAICSAVPTIVDVYLDRPAVLTDLVPQAAAVLGSYGSSDEAFLDVVFGAAKPAGSLPFDLPCSMAAVEASRSDVPYDTADPLFSFGHGLLRLRLAASSGQRSNLHYGRPSKPPTTLQRYKFRRLVDLDRAVSCRRGLTQACRSNVHQPSRAVPGVGMVEAAHGRQRHRLPFAAGRAARAAR